MSDLLLRGGRPWGFDIPADIVVRGGAIERIEPAIDVGDAQVLDESGRLMLPGCGSRVATGGPVPVPPVRRRRL